VVHLLLQDRKLAGRRLVPFLPVDTFDEAQGWPSRRTNSCCDFKLTTISTPSFSASCAVGTGGGIAARIAAP
jgi:hypothetical protein